MDATRFYSILGYHDRELAKQDGFLFCKESKRWFIESSHENFEQLSKKYEIVYLCVEHFLKNISSFILLNVKRLTLPFKTENQGLKKLMDSRR